MTENGPETSTASNPARSEPRFTREITSFIAAPILIWIIGWTPGIVFALLVAVIAVGGLWEFLNMGAQKGFPMQRLISSLLLVALLVATIWQVSLIEPVIVAILLIIPAAYVFSRSPLEDALPASAVCLLGILYVGLLSGTLMRLRLDFAPHGADLVFFLLFVVWAGDSAAYYTGKNLGRTKLLPRVSPKKTVEGLAGGVAGSIVVAAIIHSTFFPEFPLLHALVCAALLSLVGVVGDLAESVWKRSAGIKDSGKLIPGHGGILDRVDSILFTAPVIYAYWFVLIR
ncbi:MAG: phosphatidate cytidylyltransferase [Thermoanaerobaculia bacterium]|nr:phosphatidate cytidylyltransferase [Thermoanaerobaculia bacterium]